MSSARFDRRSSPADRWWRFGSSTTRPSPVAARFRSASADTTVAGITVEERPGSFRAHVPPQRRLAVAGARHRDDLASDARNPAAKRNPVRSGAVTGHRRGDHHIGDRSGDSPTSPSVSPPIGAHEPCTTCVLCASRRPCSRRASIACIEFSGKFRKGRCKNQFQRGNIKGGSYFTSHFQFAARSNSP